MRIFLDSRDLILLAERRPDAYFAEFGEWLRRRGSNLVLSLSPILECCVPLSQPGTQASVMRTLARIEGLPHLFIAEAKIHRDELTSAVRAYSQSTEYESIDPYVTRFDEVISPFQPPATNIYLTYGLAHTVFELWRERPELFSQDIHDSERLAASRELDRSDPGHRRHKPNFSEYVRRTLAQFRIAFPQDGVDTLASWIWAEPHRCPSFRLGYEVYHQILRNITDDSGDADIGDLTHVGCLPYVEAMTLDRRMRGYVAQADRALATIYANRVFADLQELRADCG